jgi:hypothetical protein
LDEPKLAIASSSHLALLFRRADEFLRTPSRRERSDVSVDRCLDEAKSAER